MSALYGIFVRLCVCVRVLIQGENAANSVPVSIIPTFAGNFVKMFIAFLRMSASSYERLACQQYQWSGTCSREEIGQKATDWEIIYIKKI